MKIARLTLYNWIKADPDLQEAREQAWESALDMTEGALLTNIQSGKEASIIFMLKTRGHSRGYRERQEVEHSGKIQIDSTDEKL